MNQSISNFTEQFYAETLQYFINKSDQVDKVYDLIKNFIIKEKKCEKLKSYMDIGAGTGTMGKLMSEYFEQIHLIEPNNEHNYNDIKNCVSHRTNYLNMNFDNKMNFILCSHVLYHIDINLWENVVLKMKNQLDENGKGVIIMISDSGRFHDLLFSLNENYSNSKKVKDILNKNNIKYNLIKYNTTFRTNDYDRFKCLLKLFVIDDCFSPEEYKNFDEDKKNYIEEKINEYIKTCKIDDEYIYVEDDDFIIIE